MKIIEVNNLTKYFVVHKRQPGLKGILRNMVKPERMIKKAVDGINFNVSRGEIIGFIGQNGAGKSTTIKMLTGILIPTAGNIKVNGKDPYKNRIQNANNIGVVFGQRTQLWWNLPVIESFDLLRTIYKVPMNIYKRNIDVFAEMLEIDKFMFTPVRQLSLGQRMRVELAATLLHNPGIVYLDEPTIGLDVLAKEKIREFIRKINKENNVTVILTTHDIGDIEKLCNRIIIIDKGAIIYDGDIVKIKELFGNDRTLIVDLEDEVENFYSDMGIVMKEENTRKHILFNRNEVSAIDLVNSLSKRYVIKDFMLKEPEVENIIRHIYQNELKLK